VVSHFVHRFCGVCVFCFGYAHYCKLSFVFKLKVPQKRNTKVVQHIIYTKKLKMRKQKTHHPGRFVFFFASRRNFFFFVSFFLWVSGTTRRGAKDIHTPTHTHTHAHTHTQHLGQERGQICCTCTCTCRVKGAFCGTGFTCWCCR